MTQKVAPIPKGYRTATPCLIVNGVDAAIEFYSAAFAAEVLTQTKDTTESWTTHVTLKIGNSLVMLQQESPELGILSPATLGNTGAQVHLYVEDMTALWGSALEAGAFSIADPIDTYWGDKSGVLLDPFGHRWSLASRIERVSVEESKKRAVELYTIPQTWVESEPQITDETDLESQEIAA
jgi:PhnB protein